MSIHLHAIDYAVMAAYVAVMVFIGLYFARRAGKSQESFFTAGRSLPWYIIALTSSVAWMGGLPLMLSVYYTHGIAARWIVDTQFMVFIPVVAVFLAPLWRGLDLQSTPEMIGHRYGSDRAANTTFRTVYGMFMSFGWGAMLMGYVLGYSTQAIAQPVFGVEPWVLIIALCCVVLAYSALSGLYGVAYADVVQFAIYVAALALCIPVVVRAAGGWNHMYESIAQNSPHFLECFPGGKAVSWSMWSILLFQSLFLGVHPNFGEGFIAQRFLAARNPAHAKVGLVVACVLSAICIMLPCGLLVTGVSAIHPGLSEEAAKGNYARLLTLLPPGVLGVLLVGELAVILGTIASITNWGASIVTNDVYRLHFVKHAPEKHYARMGAVFGLLMLAIGAVVGSCLVKEFYSWFVFINTATMTFILPIGFLRYFWWRFNIWGEIVAIAVGVPFCIIVWFVLGGSEWPFWKVFFTLFGSGALTIVAAALVTKPTDMEVLEAFYLKCRPRGFWRPVRERIARQAAQPFEPGFDTATLFEFALTLAALGCMFLAINTFLGHRLALSAAAACGFLIFGGGVVLLSWKSLFNDEEADLE